MEQTVQVITVAAIVTNIIHDCDPEAVARP